MSLCVCTLLAFALKLADASEFLGTAARVALEADDGAASARLLEALKASHGNQSAVNHEDRIADIERLLSPIFVALPKSEQGTVGAAAARYALHRLFVQRHGWQVRGLEPRGGSWDAASPVDALSDRMSEHVRGLLEDHLGTRGLTLRELATFASAIESLVHSEAAGRVRSVFRALDFEQSGELSEEQANAAIESYMAAYIMGANFTALSPASLRKQNAHIEDQYPSWPETKKWLHEVQAEVKAGVKSFNMNAIETVVEHVGERYGRWQSKECTTLKQTLLGLEEAGGTGRVRLGDFYRSALHDGNWQFSESAAYLRQLGALDDSDSSALKLIIPNYINGPSNCIASSGFYAVCCIDECEDLLGHLESKLGAPTATPAEIVTLVAALPSASVPSNRTLSAALLRRLDDVAQHHGGRIPLHGRLFAQWMHHAYPRECPYPHVTGTTAPRTAEEWESETGDHVVASKEEMEGVIEASKTSGRSQPNREEGLCSAMWTMEEELVVKQQSARSPAAAPALGARTGGRAIMRGLALAGAAIFAVLTLVKMVGPMVSDASAGLKGSSRDAPKEKVYAV